MHTSTTEQADQERISLHAWFENACSKSKCSCADCGCLQGGGLSADTCVKPVQHNCSKLQAPPERQLSSRPPAEDVILILDSSDDDEAPAGPSSPAGPAVSGSKPSQGAAAGRAPLPLHRPGQATGSQLRHQFGSISPAERPALAAPATPQALQGPAASQQTSTSGAQLPPAATRAGNSGPAPSAGLLAAAAAKLSASGNEGPASSTGTSQSHLVQPASPRAPVPGKSQAQAAALSEQRTGSGSPSGGNQCAATPRPPDGSFRWSSPARQPHTHPAPVAAVLATLAALHSGTPCSSSSSRPADPAAAGAAVTQHAGAPAAPGRPSSMAGCPGAGLAGTLLAGSSLMAPQGAPSATPGMAPTQQLQGGPSGGTRLLPPCPPRVVDVELGQLPAFADIAAVSKPFSNPPEPSFNMTQPRNHTVSRPRPGSFIGQAGTQPAPQAPLLRLASTSRPGQPQQNGISGMASQRQQATCQRPLPAGAVRPGQATPRQRRMDAGWAQAIAAVERDFAQGPMDGFVNK